MSQRPQTVAFMRFFSTPNWSIYSPCRWRGMQSVEHMSKCVTAELSGSQKDASLTGMRACFICQPEHQAPPSSQQHWCHPLRAPCSCPPRPDLVLISPSWPRTCCLWWPAGLPDKLHPNTKGSRKETCSCKHQSLVIKKIITLSDMFFFIFLRLKISVIFPPTANSVESNSGNYLNVQII